MDHTFRDEDRVVIAEFHGVGPFRGTVIQVDEEHVELINMGMIECKHGWDLHAMGNVRQGSGGTEWAAIYDDEFLVRFTAMQAEITYSDDGKPSIRALVHPMYCDNIQEECRISMKLPRG